MKKLLLINLILLAFNSQAMVNTEIETEPGATKIGIEQIETQPESKKINIQQKIWELLGHQKVPSLLFIQQLKQAHMSNEEIAKLDIPIELKESIIELKDKLADEIQYILMNEDFIPEGKNDIITLINAGANIDFQDPGRGMTAVHHAAINGNKEMVELFIEKKANLNLPNKYGATPLMSAILSENPGIAELLIDEGANVAKESNSGETALILAVRERYHDLVKQIIAAFINLNPDNKNALIEFINHEAQGGETALIEAINSNKKEIVKLLIENGANPNLKNKNGLSALEIKKNHRDQAILNNYEELVNINQEIINILEKAEEKH